MPKTSDTGYLGLDVGQARIGVASAGADVPIARAYGAIVADDTAIDEICQIARDEQASVIIVGYPRNQSGEPTAQTKLVEEFTEQLQKSFEGEIIYQDESLTSVMAENRLRDRRKPYARGDIDAEAACIILTDYLESRHG